jgi:hypothetical protein
MMVGSGDTGHTDEETPKRRKQREERSTNTALAARERWLTCSGHKKMLSPKTKNRRHTKDRQVATADSTSSNTQ